MILYKIIKEANIEKDGISNDNKHKSPAKIVKEKQVIFKKKPGTLSLPLRKISKAKIQKSLPFIKREPFEEVLSKEEVSGRGLYAYTRISRLILKRKGRFRVTATFLIDFSQKESLRALSWGFSRAQTISNTT